MRAALVVWVLLDTGCERGRGHLSPARPGDAGSTGVAASEGGPPGKPGPPPTEATCRPTSGTRLRARFLGSEEGVSVFVGWFDKQLGVPCAFTRATDGRLRCLPEGAASFFGHGYSDPACTSAVTSIASCMDGVRHAVNLRPTSGCGDRALEVYALGEALPPQTMEYWRRSDLECMARPPAGTLRPILGVMPPSDFVAAREDPGPAGRIGVSALTGEDGSRQPCGLPASPLFDRQRDESCALSITSMDGAVHCLPVQRASGGRSVYGDEKCQRGRFTSSPASGCPDPRYYIGSQQVIRSDLCGFTNFSYHSVSLVKEAPAAGWKYDTTGGTFGCHPVTPAPGEKFWDPGQFIPSSEFAAGTPVAAPETARVRARYWELPGGLRQFRGDFQDTRLQLACQAGLAADGKIRCLPGLGTPVVTAFRDSACTDLVRVVVSDFCAHPQPVVGIATEAAGCEQRTRVYPFTTAMGVELFGKQGTSCVPLPRSRGLGGVDGTATYRLVGEEIPPAELMPLAITVE